MTDLEELIKWWNDQFDGHGPQWSTHQCRMVADTIKALEELKKREGE